MMLNAFLDIRWPQWLKVMPEVRGTHPLEILGVCPQPTARELPYGSQ